MQHIVCIHTHMRARVPLSPTKSTRPLVACILMQQNNKIAKAQDLTPSQGRISLLEVTKFNKIPLQQNAD